MFIKDKYLEFIQDLNEAEKANKEDSFITTAEEYMDSVLWKLRA